MILRMFILILTICFFFLIIDIFKIKKENFLFVKNQIYTHTDDSERKITLIKKNNSSFLFVETKVNNVPAIFLLDTGASVTLLDSSNIKKYSLQFDSEKYRVLDGIGGAGSLYAVTNQSEIEIGGIKYYCKLHISNIDNIVKTIKDEYNIKIDGILGSDFFSNHSIMFDYGKSIIITR